MGLLFKADPMCTSTGPKSYQGVLCLSLPDALARPIVLRARGVTLVSTLIGPLIILCLLLKFGVCVLNHLVAPIKEYLKTANNGAQTTL